MACFLKKKKKKKKIAKNEGNKFFSEMPKSTKQACVRYFYCTKRDSQTNSVAWMLCHLNVAQYLQQGVERRFQFKKKKKKKKEIWFKSLCELLLRAAKCAMREMDYYNEGVLQLSRIHKRDFPMCQPIWSEHAFGRPLAITLVPPQGGTLGFSLSCYVKNELTLVV
jgi:hypothetical protein